jgi:hypothetical protein
MRERALSRPAQKTPERFFDAELEMLKTWPENES